MVDPENFGVVKSLDDEAFGPVVLTAAELLVLRLWDAPVVEVSAGGMGNAVALRERLEARLKKYR
jgi:ATP-dependent protease HslVU (ClpYQ) peptidase subunit